MLQTFKLLKGIENVDVKTFLNLSANGIVIPQRQITVVSDDTNVATPAHGLLMSCSKLFLSAFGARWNLLPFANKQSDYVLTFKSS